MESSMAKEQKNKHFFKDFKAELKKVIWPTPKQIVNSTIAVATIVLITAAIVFVLDIAFDTLNKYGINQLKENIKKNTDNSVQEEIDITDEQEEENAEDNVIDVPEEGEVETETEQYGNE
jgi:preprotein translocase subunit SecE